MAILLGSKLKAAFASLNARKAEVQAIQSQQGAISRDIFRLKTEFNRLERRKRILIRRIEKAAERIRRISGRIVPESIIRKVEERINQERWMEKIIEARFRSQSRHGPGSMKWKRLSPTYERAKARAGFGNKILVYTGVLKESTVEAVAGTYKYRAPIQWNPGIVPVEYAGFVHQERPFILPPSTKELKRVDARAVRLIDIELRIAQKEAS